MPSGSFFYVYSLSRKLRLGLGTYSYFAGPLEYNLNWVGRYYLQEATLLGVSFEPAVAYRITNWLSVGAGPNVMVGFLRAKAATNNLNPNYGDGQVKYQDYTVGVSGDIGILLTPRDGTRIGITYLTPVDLNFSDVAHFTGLGPRLSRVLERRKLLGASVDLGVEVPQQLMVDFYQKITERVALLGSVGWQNWSQFGLVEISVNSAKPTSLTKNLDFQDTFHIAAGAQYKLHAPWLLSCGFAFDNSPVSNAERTVNFPFGDQYRFGAGVQYALSNNVTLGFADEFMYQGQLLIYQSEGLVKGAVAGQFTDSFINFVCLNIKYKV